MKPINVGLIGIGTVGGGTWTVLKRNAEEITRRAGRPIRITAVADRNVELAKQMTGGDSKAQPSTDLGNGEFSLTSAVGATSAVRFQDVVQISVPFMPFSTPQ